MSVSCLNCDNSFEGNFCPACGQRSHTPRIGLHSIAHDIPHSVLHIDKGFGYTFIQLLKRPGKAIKEYIDGKRVSHYSPVAYLLLLCAASSFVSHLKSVYWEHVEHRPLFISPSVPFPEAARFFDSYPALMFCLLIPVISLWTWIFYSRQKYNYWEHVVLNIYLVAQFNLFFIFYDVYTVLSGKASGSLTPMLTVFFAYISISYFQFFGKSHSLAGVAARVALLVLIVFTVITAISLAGVMTPWWGF